MAKRKPLTVQKLTEKAATLTQKVRRMEEADDNGMCACVSCGTVKHWTEMQGGHWIARTSSRHKLNPDNVFPQCVFCNHFDKENAHVAYTVFMIKRNGQEWVDEMLATRKGPYKRTRAELEELIVALKERINQQKQRLGE
jgi:hypothetical protein